MASAEAATTRATNKARDDLFKLFPAAQENAAAGFQSALDVFGQSLPAQSQVFQQGNVAAQQQLLSGLPQFQNAILGGNVDLSQLQPTQLQQPDLSFFQQQLPQFNDPFAQQAQQPGGEFVGPLVTTRDPLSGIFGQNKLGGPGNFSGLVR
ncbi:MAG: hypothetical protein JKY89_10945 [Immundisolibacteraceae bacterium]|nr:hypothetical protein [Immundisolibacteraceae bacterium]